MLRQPSTPTWLPRRRRTRGLTTATGPRPMSATNSRTGTPTCGAARPIPCARRMLTSMSATSWRVVRSTVRIGRLRLLSTAASESRTVTIRLGRPRAPPSPLMRRAGRRLVTASGPEPAAGFARLWQKDQACPSWTAVDACSWSLRGTATGSAHPRDVFLSARRGNSLPGPPSMPADALRSAIGSGRRRRSRRPRAPGSQRPRRGTRRPERLPRRGRAGRAACPL